MKVNRIRQNVLPVLAAFIWGTAFVAQSVGAELVEAFTFNAARSAIAFVVLLAVCLLLRKFGQEKPRTAAYWRDLAISGICCGTALTVAAYFQQKGMETTTSGKAGFITALYIVGVPSIKEFALPLMVGILAGAFSSVCLTGPLWYVLRKAKDVKDMAAAKAQAEAAAATKITSSKKKKGKKAAK